MLENGITRTSTSGSSQKNSIASQSRNNKSGTRRSDRRRNNRLAWLVVKGQRQRFHAAMRDYDENGANLTVSGLMGIPDRFLLYVEPDCIRYECSVTQSRGNTVSVRFVETKQNIRYRDDHK